MVSSSYVHTENVSPEEYRLVKKRDIIRNHMDKTIASSEYRLAIITCGCKAKCKTARCSCYKLGIKYTPSCGCDAEG